MPSRSYNAGRKSGQIIVVATPTKRRAMKPVIPSFVGIDVICPHCKSTVPVRKGNQTVGYNIIASHAMDGSKSSVRTGRPHCPGSATPAENAERSEESAL